MTVPPPHGAGQASQCSNTRIAATHTRPLSNIRDRIGCLLSLCASPGARCKRSNRTSVALATRLIDLVTVPPPHGVGQASQCSNTRIAATHTRPWSNIRDRIGRLCARAQGLVVTVKPYQRRIGDSPHRSGDCPTTTWCGPSLTVLKHPHCGHSHASVVKYP